MATKRHYEAYSKFVFKRALLKLYLMMVKVEGIFYLYEIICSYWAHKNMSLRESGNNYFILIWRHLSYMRKN